MNGEELLDVPVADVVAGCPAAARVFLDRRMACVGCPFARFETVAEVAAVYGVNPLDLARALADAAPATAAHEGALQ
jgi:hybrid cluster-associated redox disulfide protein